MKHKIRLLFLTQYFPPEVGAPQNRLYELAVRLQKQNIDIEVLTAMPNYPQMEIHPQYKGKKYMLEEMNGIKVHRSSIYVTKKRGVISRLRNYFSFVFSSYRTGKKRLGDFDYIFCESPPLFLGITAYRLSQKKKAGMIFNVSDLWPESAERLGIITNKMMLKAGKWLEEYLYEKAVLISGQTQGIVENIRKRFPDKKYCWLPNGVDPEFYYPRPINKAWRESNGFNENDFLLLYAGIIGHAQGLEIIIDAAEKLKTEEHIHFLFLGSGPEKEKLISLKEEKQLDRIHFIETVPKSSMPEIIAAANAALVPLKKLDIFLGAIPSKIFENMAMGKAVLLGVDGEARKLFVENAGAALYCEPENMEALVFNIRKLYQSEDLCKRLGNKGQAYVHTHFSRDKIAANFLKEINNINPS